MWSGGIIEYRNGKGDGGCADGEDVVVGVRVVVRRRWRVPAGEVRDEFEAAEEAVGEGHNEDGNDAGFRVGRVGELFHDVIRNQGRLQAFLFAAEDERKLLVSLRRTALSLYRTSVLFEEVRFVVCEAPKTDTPIHKGEAEISRAAIHRRTSRRPVTGRCRIDGEALQSEEEGYRKAADEAGGDESSMQGVLGRVATVVLSRGSHIHTGDAGIHCGSEGGAGSKLGKEGVGDRA